MPLSLLGTLFSLFHSKLRARSANKPKWRCCEGPTAPRFTCAYHLSRGCCLAPLSRCHLLPLLLQPLDSPSILITLQLCQVGRVLSRPMSSSLSFPLLPPVPSPQCKCLCTSPTAWSLLALHQIQVFLPPPWWARVLQCLAALSLPLLPPLDNLRSYQTFVRPRKLESCSPPRLEPQGISPPRRTPSLSHAALLDPWKT